jgi:uncharacterized lipoprotein YmbA
MANQFSKWLIILFAGSLLPACMSTPATQFYVLEPISDSSAKPATLEKKRQIGVGPVSIPAMLARKQIVTRLPDSSVKVAEFHQWASPLKDNIAEVLTHNLATLQSDDLVRAYPWSALGTVDYRVVIDIIRFDSRPDQSVNLEANWTIMNEKNHAVVSNGRTKIEHPLEDSSYPAIVKALSKSLNELSQEISVALNKIK